MESKLGKPRPGVGMWAAWVFGAVLILIGGLLAAGGVRLIMLGGSWYYLLAGVGLIVSGGLLLTGRSLGGLVYGGVALLTLIWGLAEAGFSFWPLLPRIFAPAVLGVVMLLVLLGVQKDRFRRPAFMTVGAATGLSLLVLAATIPRLYGAGVAEAPEGPARPATAAAGVPGDWRFYGRDSGGKRFAPYAQITKDNVDQLRVAWTVRTGDIADKGSEDQNTPLQVGDTLYICTPTNRVIAVDADTGRERWRFNPQVRRGFWNRCRGVGYHETTTPAAPAAPTRSGVVASQAAGAPECARRILLTALDARLIALDAATGRPCAGFGVNGTVDLKVGMGPIKPGFYMPTSMPTVAGGLVIVGGWVLDNRELNEPPGVVRAFDAVTGRLVWAWDLGDPSITTLPPEGRTYTRGTPNVWSTPAFDPALGLIYLPTGNATPDYWGSHRTEAADRYNSSVVALDIATGKERWRYQTVHHDVWDYDVPSQPMLTDFPDGRGGTTSALIQLTKRGQIFVLDRRTGQPITPVEERTVPQGPAPGEWLSPTQPYSIGMPTIGATKLTEKMMWGTTPLDHMVCRIIFKSKRYEGDFTPPGLKPNIHYPGYGGGQNWGSGTLDATRNYLITGEMRLPTSVVLKPSDDARHSLALAPNRSPRGAKAVSYDDELTVLLSPIGVPCLQPPHGTLTAVDLNTRKIAWQVPLGTAEKSGPFGQAWGLKLPIGTQGLAGPMTTAGGLVFHSATTDWYLRAYDTATGKVVWRSPLPVGSGATPMSYVSPKTGKQYVVVNAGGSRNMPGRGDYVIAYSLPDRTERAAR